MKRIYGIIACAVSAAVLLSCVKEETAHVQPSEDDRTLVEELPVETIGKITFTASANCTKTSVGEDNATVLWDAEDMIAVFDGTLEVRTFTTVDGGENAVFEGVADTKATEYYALYPYDAEAEFTSEKKITTSVPAAQSGQFDGHVTVAYTTAEDKLLSFKNVTGVVKFTLDEDYVTKVTLKGNNNEVLAGDLSIDWNGGDPSVAVTNGTTEITLGDGSTVLEKGDYYFVVAPADLTAGLTVSLTIKDAASYVKSGKKPIAISSGKLLDMGKVTTTVTIYDDALISQYGVNVTGSSKDGDVDFACTESPYSGTYCIKWTPSVAGDYLRIQFEDYIDFSDAEMRDYNLEFKMKEETTNWLNSNYFYFYFVDSVKNPDKAAYSYRQNAILNYNEKNGESGSEPKYWHTFSIPLDEFWQNDTYAVTGAVVKAGSKTTVDYSSNNKWLPDMKYLNEFAIYYRQNTASTIYIDDIKICKQSITYNHIN